MFSRSCSIVVTVVGSRGIVGCSGIYILDVAGDVPAALVVLKLIWGP